MLANFPIPKVTFQSGDAPLDRTPLLVWGLAKSPDPERIALPGKIPEADRLIAGGDFRAENLETILVYPEKGPERLLLIGLGDPTNMDIDHFRRFGAKAAREAKRLRVGQFTIQLPPEAGADVLRVVAQGAVLGTADPKTTPDAPPIKSISIHGREGSDEIARLGTALAEATFFARSLVIEPPNRLTPAALAEHAEGIASEKGVTVRVFDEKAIEKEGLHALANVGMGSSNKPRFVVAEYDGTGGEGPLVALIGKGITFDSGGLSLKSADRMVNMKYDMGGSAAVLGAFRSAARLSLPIRIAAIIPSAENMPSADAYRPGDVVPSYKGLTIEVDNTDAEGRLVLADGLAWAEKNLKPDEMIDAATLTGACRIALGRHAAGLFSNDDAFAARIRQAGHLSGELVWQLPLWNQYDRELESDVADMKNVGRGGAGGGASVAASFLYRFVDQTPWAHLDIAGMAWNNSKNELFNRGPTGFGAGLLLTYLAERSGRGTS